MFYLLKEDWSPRFESFFTVTITTWMTYSSVPPSSSSSSSQTTSTESSPLISSNRSYNLTRGGNSKFPAVYYNLKVQSGRKEHLCPRRYSQFRKLYDEIKATPSPTPDQASLSASTRPINIPPKTCFCQTIDDEFLDVRQEELYHFLTSLLTTGHANHPAMIAFLELDSFSNTDQ
mmetsp:Transcript_19903/g.29811  ORF Transcript_19903/g.29811 Transcript_19903/m.29811 type:complete len:175 (-) Transcript_19903:33-557(-)